MASRSSTRTVQIAHNVLVRAVRQADRDVVVARNVAALVKPPKGQGAGRPSKSLTLEQAIALMTAARGTRLEASITLSLLTGLRTEEVRALRWDHVVAWVAGQWEPVSEAGFDHEQLAVFVWRADRAGGDTKTARSRDAGVAAAARSKLAGTCTGSGASRHATGSNSEASARSARSSSSAAAAPESMPDRGSTRPGYLIRSARSRCFVLLRQRDCLVPGPLWVRLAARLCARRIQ
jgi:integrase